MTPAAAIDHRPSLTLYRVSLSFLVTAPNTKHYRVMHSHMGWEPAAPLCTPIRFAGSFKSRHNSKSAPRWCHHRLSFTAFHTPMATLEVSRLDVTQDRPKPRCYVTAPVLWAGSLTKAYPPVQRLPGHRGFILCSVTGLHRPRVFSTTRESATLCTQPRFGFAFTVRFFLRDLWQL